MLTKDCLAKALQNVSGKTIPEDVLAKCTTTCEVIDEFNALFRCAVTFNGVVGSTNVNSSLVLTVKDANGNTIAPTAERTYTLTEGSYTYDASASGAVAKKGEKLIITNSDEQNGTKTVVVAFTAA